MLAGGLARTGYNQNETTITDANVGEARRQVEVRHGRAGRRVARRRHGRSAGRRQRRLVIVGSYDGNVYAIRADDGKEPGASPSSRSLAVSYGAIVSTAVSREGRRQAARLRRRAARRCTRSTRPRARRSGSSTPAPAARRATPRPSATRSLSSPGGAAGRGPGASSAWTSTTARPARAASTRSPRRTGGCAGTSTWRAGATCTPERDDDIRRFDGFHSADAARPAGDFFATRDGCDFDRTETACGNVWSPVSVDTEPQADLLHVEQLRHRRRPDDARSRRRRCRSTTRRSSRCTTTARRPGPGVRARSTTTTSPSAPAPNLFTATIEGKERDVVGIGGKDGSYYLLDRDGTNEITGKIEPYWTTQRRAGRRHRRHQLARAARDGRQDLLLTTAINEGARGLGARRSRRQRWSGRTKTPRRSTARRAPIPGLVFTGGIDAKLHAIDADTGEILAAVPLGHIVFSSRPSWTARSTSAPASARQGGAAGGHREGARPRSGRSASRVRKDVKM